AGPLRLRLERRERGLHGWRSKPAAFEIAADGGVAVAAGGKRLGARGGGALVVDVARRREALDRLRRLGGVDAGPLQGGRELGRRVVPPRERLRRELERGLLRHRQAAGAGSSSASTGVASRGSLWVRSRAETICPSAACAWIPCRICWTTSGCSSRKAVAFWRPWPSRSSPKLKYAPDFWTTFRSTAASRTVPSQEMPLPQMTSNSACLNGGATLFFATLTRTRLPIASRPSLSVSIRRMSSRTEA